MGQYAVLAALLVGEGVAIGMFLPDNFSLGGWVTAGVLFLFALVIGRTWSRSS